MVEISRRGALLPLSARSRTGLSHTAGATPAPLWATVVDTPPVTTQAAHLARRATYIPSPAAIAEIEQLGADAWIDRQLSPTAINDSACTNLMNQHFPWLNMTSLQIRQTTGNKEYLGGVMLIRASTVRRLLTKRQLFEVVVDVMSNQIYATATAKVQDQVVDFDRQVIRKYALGKFADFLQGAITHPAMLEFLDNAVSTKDDPNENLGRELLELYTVGTGNYTEDDVRQSSLLLTGHGYKQSTLTYQYNPNNHYVGPLQIMGFSHPNDTATGGPAVLRAYLAYLARHPSTAERVCHRLAVRFVSDDPSPALIADLVATYQDADTNIAAVVKRLLTHPEFTASVGLKWRTPAEHVTAMVGLGKGPYTPVYKPTSFPTRIIQTIYGLLDRAGNNPRCWPAVNGYPDVASYWLVTSKLQQAWAAAETVAMRTDPDFRPLPWAQNLGVTPGQRAWVAAASITLALTGYTWSQTDIGVIAGMLANQGRTGAPGPSYRLTAANISNNLDEAVRIVFASPYFMLR